MSLEGSRRALVLGLGLGLLFGGVNLLVTWLYPLLDDTPAVLLRFYGPMFVAWSVASYLAARRTGRQPAAVRES